MEILRTDKKFCQQKVEIPETDTKNSLPLSLPAKGGNPETRTKKFCQQKVEIPETDTKNSLPLSLPAKGGNSETRTKNSASKKWKFPKTGTKNLFPSPLPAKWWNIAQRGTEKGKENHNEAVARIARKVEWKKGRSSE
ncbi:MAG: hypothetical protein V2G48_07850 [bacterium JZ-2024 1]